MTDRVCVARIGAAHGVRGEVRLWAFTEDPAAIADYGPLETEDGQRRFEIARMRAAKDHFVARLSGIDDRDAAEALRNIELYVPRERLPAIEDDEPSTTPTWSALAVTADGATLGTVMAVQNFGAGDMVEIAPADGGAPLMLSFTAANVPAVDVKAGRIVVAVPDEIEAGEPDGDKQER